MGVPVESLREWHEFFVFLGTVAATLVGAMFVVVSIGVGFLTRERAGEIREFVTPTMIHLATVILVSALALVPALEGRALAALLGIAGIIGLVYSAAIGLNIRRRAVERGDRVWYALLPLFGYAALWAAALLAWLDAAAGPKTMAAALAVLLVASLRNAWDIILFIVTRPRGPG